MGLAQANVTSLISQSSSVEKRGEIIGINSGIQALAQAMPPILSGFLAASLSLATPLLVSGSVLLLSGLLLFQFYKTPKVG